MFSNETHVRSVTKQFMPRVKNNSINAILMLPLMAYRYLLLLRNMG